MRIFLAIRAFFSVLFSKAYATKVRKLALEDRSNAIPSLTILAVLQREGRLVDFLREDIDQLEDDQIGAAVRAIHKGCRKVLAEQLHLEPILSDPEGTSVEIPMGFDPSAIRLIGNVKGDPPFNGILKHHGWRAAEVRLPDPLPGVDPRVVAPAEVEIL